MGERGVLFSSGQARFRTTNVRRALMCRACFA